MAPREGGGGGRAGGGGRQLIAVRHAKDIDFANGHKNVREDGKTFWFIASFPPCVPDKIR